MKYYIKTFGCLMNHSDSERIAGFLDKNNFQKVDDINSADLVVFNTCGVRQMAEDRVYGQIHNLKKTNPKAKIVLTGCLSQRKDVQKRLKNKVNLFLPINKLEKIKKVCHPNPACRTRSQKHKKILNQVQNDNNYFHIKPKYNSKHTALVPIMTGCNNFCSYCVVPYARGREFSRSPEEILQEVKNLVKKDYKEIILLGQNVNSYQFIDKNSSTINFSKLLKKINDIPGNFWINFVSNHPKDITDEFIETVTKLPKVCECIHFPLQAGDNKILKKMNRQYTAKKYLDSIEKIKKSFAKNKPENLFSITSDIIVGFPGENRKQFLQSKKIMQKVAYDMVYFGQFSPRPGTVAFEMKDNISKQEKVRREKELTQVLRKTSLQNNQKHLGKTMEILIEKEKGDSYFGRTRTGKRIKLKKTKNNLQGKIVKAKITKANTWNLEASLSQNPKNLPKIVVILGPTSSGKSDAAIKLAQKFNGEIISADSRQVFKWLNIGSGKVSQKEQQLVPHWLLDIANPQKEYNVSHFKRDAQKKIKEILERGKLPIICGGTGFWIKALVQNENYPEVKPNQKLREKLQKESNQKLFEKLKKLDSQRAQSIDSKNKIRLIRAIEIAKKLGKVPEIKSKPKYDALQIGISWSKEELNKRIEKRLRIRFKDGLVQEIKNLHEKHRVSWKRMKEFGLAYTHIPEFLKGKTTQEEAFQKILQDEKNYAKRQRTWWKKDKSILWLSRYSDAKKEVQKFLK